jgi:hypothetical protein
MPIPSFLVADLTPTIRQILQGYGKESLFKEILQNSDDAKATVQVSVKQVMHIALLMSTCSDSSLIAVLIRTKVF